MDIPRIEKICAEVTVPGSKSITARAIHMASLANGTSSIENLLDCQDSQVLRSAWRHLGASFKEKEGSLEVIGCNGKLGSSPGVLNVANAGTAMRFLASVLATTNTTYVLTGNEAMRQRPIGPLVETLKTFGALVSYREKTGCPPLRFDPSRIVFPDVWNIDSDMSSQYVSSLLMLAPLAKKDITIKISSTLVSRPYVDLTIQMMKQFGVYTHWVGFKEIHVKGSDGYKAANILVESDASSASYFWGLAAITNSSIKVKNIHEDSWQGDIRFLKALEQMGCIIESKKNGICVTGPKELKPIILDMGDIPDVALTLSAVALFAKGRSRLYNVKHMRYKECDRLSALVSELQKLGAKVKEFEDAIEIEGGYELKGDQMLETYDDHRMAMTFAIIGCRVLGIKISDPLCVNKSFPKFFDSLTELRTKCS